MHSAKVVLKYNGIKQKTVYTNSNGYYSISCSYYGSQGYSLTFSKEDYSTASFGVPAIPGETITVNHNISYVEKWAVVVGIEKYQNLCDAAYADNNANRWKNFLEDSLSFDHISYYTNAEATEVVVKGALNNAINQVDSKDIFCFIFSGHGNEKDGYYLSMYDAPPSGTSGDEGRLYDYELASILGQCVAERIFLFFDACHAGGFSTTFSQLQNVDHIFFGAGSTAGGLAGVYEFKRIGCFTQCFLIEAWKGDFNGNEDAIFNNVTSTFDLVDLTLKHYQEHVDQGHENFFNIQGNQPIFYDWYTQPGKYFYLSKKGIIDPEKE